MSPFSLYLERARIYDLLGDKAKSAADRKIAADLKKKEDAAIVQDRLNKKKFIEYNKKKKEDEIKAAKERIKKLNEERAKNAKK